MDKRSKEVSHQRGHTAVKVTWKVVQQHMSLEKSNLKQEWDSIHASYNC